MLEGRIYDAIQVKCMIVDYSTSNLFVSMTSRLEAAGMESARTEASWLLMHVTGRSKVDVISRPNEAVSSEQITRIEGLLRRRIAGEPIQYLIGSADFYGRTFAVTPDVLIPRPETEELVERILNLGPDVLNGGVVDLGTGSGCIPSSIACELVNVECVGVDVSEEALVVAKSNAHSLGASVEWVLADMRDERLSALLGRTFSVLVSNPPYVPDEEAGSLQREVHDHEPHLALFSGPDPLHFYRAICEQAPRLVHSGGHIMVEIHADAGPSVVTLFEQCGLIDPALHSDLSGRDRIVHAKVG